MAQSLRQPSGSEVSLLEFRDSHSSEEHPRRAPAGNAAASSFECRESRASFLSFPRALSGKEEMRLEWRSRRVRRLWIWKKRGGGGENEIDSGEEKT